MNAKDVIKSSIEMSHSVTQAYLKDLADDDLRIRPLPGMNTIGWQLGHLICSERDMVAALGHLMPELPAGFAEAHEMERAKSDDTSRLARKAEYESLLDKMHAATFAALAATPDADLDQPAPERMRSYAPTVGAVFALIGQHEMMHAGQWVAVRRKLNKPIAI